VLEEPTICKSGAPTLDGSRSSSIQMKILSTGKMAEYLMLLEERTLKDKQLLPGKDTMEPTRDGRLSILTKLSQFQRKDSMQNLDSTSTDHSTLSLDFQ
jgi:hypothetical protein